MRVILSVSERTFWATSVELDAGRAAHDAGIPSAPMTKRAATSHVCPSGPVTATDAPS